MTHPIPNLTTRADQIAHYAAVKRRIQSAAYKPPALIAPPPKPRAKISNDWTRRPLWMREDIHFDWHVMSFKVQDRTAPHIKWMRTRCVELGVTYAQMIGVRGKISVTYVRMQMYAEMKEAFPDISYPQIGRAFGNRDHSSVISGIKRWRVLKCE